MKPTRFLLPLILPLLFMGLAKKGWTENVKTIERQGVLYVLAEDGTSNVPLTGTLTENHDSGILWWKTTFKDGKRDGPYELYFRNGQLEAKGTFKEGKPHGQVVQYYENGQIELKSTYKDGQRDGPFEIRSRNGKLRKKETYKDNKRHGPYETYHENGQLEEKGTYKDGEVVK